jgi:hypothetical protein
MATDLITIAEYKAYAKIQSSAEDDKLTLLIPSVSALVKNYCGRTFVDHASTVTTATSVSATEYCSDGGFFIYTAEQPIINVVSLQTRSTPYEAYVTRTVDTDYIIDKQNDYLYCLYDEIYGFSSGPNAVKIVYHGGFLDVPEDLKLAVLDLVRFYIRRESVPRAALNSNQISMENTPSVDFPSHIKRVLELYRHH